MYKPQAAAMEHKPTLPLFFLFMSEIKVGFIKEAPKLPVSGFSVYVNST
ncbi:BnaC07g51070D [Brassica napus]|uniref:BnaC07g51070D protein n=2 Tax=Brassica TaxID=3705 RepID=A0A078J5U2_BRANA|nr:BnaC07g51070D [Brassica napus]VDD41027.1 unnamed protein product [Brassica oleracea]